MDGALSALPSSVPAHPEPVRFSAEQADEVIAAIGDALADTELTIDELTEAIVDRTGLWAGEQTMEAFRGPVAALAPADEHGRTPRHALLRTELGPKVTYTNPHRWLPGFRPDDGDAALRTLVMRYLYAYGPATPSTSPDGSASRPSAPSSCSACWPASWSRSSWTVRRWTGRRHRDAVPAASGIRLLPYFDAFVVAGQPRERLYLDAAATRALTPAGQAGNYPVLLVDGVVGGVWHQRRSGRRLAITVELLGELTATQHRQLEDEVELVGAVMEASRR